MEKKSPFAKNYLTIELAMDKSVMELAAYGIFAHRKLGEQLEKVGYAPWITEKSKTAFLMGKQLERAEALFSQLCAYGKCGPKVPLAQKDVQQNTPVDILGQRIKDLEMLLGEAERRAKELVEQKQLTIDSLRGHKLALEGQIKALEEKVTLLTTDLELEKAAVEMHLDDSKRQDEHIADLKMAIRNLAVLI